MIAVESIKSSKIKFNKWIIFFGRCALSLYESLLFACCIVLLFRIVYQIWLKHAEKYAEAARWSTELQFRLATDCSGSFSGSSPWWAVFCIISAKCTNFASEICYFAMLQKFSYSDNGSSFCNFITYYAAFPLWGCIMHCTLWLLACPSVCPIQTSNMKVY